jgi:DNA-binding transcriptional LysR family regulator
MTFDLRHLRHVTILAETGNFSRAAEQAGITQPALSRSVAGLEAEVGFAIFDRTSGGAVPTIAGAQFVKDAAKLLVQARQLESDCRAVAMGEGGVLSFGLGPLLASLILPDLLVMLASRLPRLRVMPSTGSAEETLTALAERRLEMCLLAAGPEQFTGMTTRQVGSVSVGLLARTGHPLAGKKGLTLKDIGQFPLATGSFSGRMPGRSSLPEPTIVCENYHILRDIVNRSDSIWLSSRALRSSDNQPDLVELDVVDYPVARHAVLAVRLEHRTPSPASQVIETAIEEMLSSMN